MKTESTAALAKLILEKERKEKAAKKRRIIVGGSLLLAVCVGALGFYFSPTSVEETNANFASFASSELSLQRVATLLDSNPAGIVVEDAAQVRIDTIRTVIEYTLFVEAYADEEMVIAARDEIIREEIVQAEVAEQDVAAEDIVQEEAAEEETSQEEEEAKEFTNALGPPTVTPTVSLSREKDKRNSSALKVNEPLTEADIMPSFPGGEAALYQFLSKQIRYPRQAVRNKIEGTVYVRFVIEPDGTVREAEVMRGIGHGCDEEALRVVQGMPKWNPGELGGQKVPVYSSLAVNFKFL